MKVIFLLLMSNLLLSVSLAPLVQTLDSKGAKNIIFKVSNPSNEPVAASLSILQLLETDNNKEIKEETNLVQAYPTQFVLDPQETKTIRVRYMNKDLPKIEEVYRVVAKELDIDVSDKEERNTKEKIKAQIKMRFSYEGLLFVKKPECEPLLKVKSLNKSLGGMTVVITNSGTASAVPNPNDYDFLITADGKEYKLTSEDLKGAEFRRVLAGKSNTFYLQSIGSVPLDKIVSIRLEKK